MTIIYAIKLAKNNFSNLSSDGFENLLQCTQELKNTGLVDVTCDHLKSQNKFELAEIIKKIADLDEHYICNFQENESYQACFSTTMQVIEQAKLAFLEGKVLICDDLQLWKQLQHSVLDNTYLPYDFVEKLYLYFLNPCKIRVLKKTFGRITFLKTP